MEKKRLDLHERSLKVQEMNDSLFTTLFITVEEGFPHNKDHFDFGWKVILELLDLEAEWRFVYFDSDDEPFEDHCTGVKPIMDKIRLYRMWYFKAKNARDEMYPTL